MSYTLFVTWNGAAEKNPTAMLFYLTSSHASNKFSRCQAFLSYPLTTPFFVKRGLAIRDNDTLSGSLCFPRIYNLTNTLQSVYKAR